MNDELRPHLDIVTADIWWRVHARGREGNWRQLCLSEFGGVILARLDMLDVDAAGRDDAIRALYELFRIAHEKDFYNGSGLRGWLRADTNFAATRILEDLIDVEGDERRICAEAQELQRVDLEPVLGFSLPTLRLVVHRRSRKWLVKFVEEGVLRGRERARADLPAVVRPAVPRVGDREEVVL
jgi:hypothetical protein